MEDQESILILFEHFEVIKEGDLVLDLHFCQAIIDEPKGVESEVEDAILAVRHLKVFNIDVLESLLAIV